MKDENWTDRFVGPQRIFQIKDPAALRVQEVVIGAFDGESFTDYRFGYLVTWYNLDYKNPSSRTKVSFTKRIFSNIYERNLEMERFIISLIDDGWKGIDPTSKVSMKDIITAKQRQRSCFPKVKQIEDKKKTLIQNRLEGLSLEKNK